MNTEYKRQITEEELQNHVKSAQPYKQRYLNKNQKPSFLGLLCWSDGGEGVGKALSRLLVELCTGTAQVEPRPARCSRM